MTSALVIGLVSSASATPSTPANNTKGNTNTPAQGRGVTATVSRVAGVAEGAVTSYRPLTGPQVAQQAHQQILWKAEHQAEEIAKEKYFYNTLAWDNAVAKNLRWDNAVAAFLAKEHATAPAAYAAGGNMPASVASMFSCIRNAESGGNYSAVNRSSGAGGAYQFMPSTWWSLGGTGLPQNAPPAEQDAMALKLYQRDGWSPWAGDPCVG